MASPDGLWDRLLRQFVPVVIVLVGATASFFVASMGIVALVVIWLLVALGIAATYIMKLRKELSANRVRTPAQDASPPSRPVDRTVRLFKVTLRAGEDDEFVFHQKGFEHPAAIEVFVKSPYSVGFAFFMMSETDFESYSAGRRNWEYLAGNEKTSSYHEVIQVPEAGLWYFVVEKPADLQWLVVDLEVNLLGGSA